MAHLGKQIGVWEALSLERGELAQEIENRVIQKMSNRGYYLMLCNSDLKERVKYADISCLN